MFAGVIASTRRTSAPPGCDQISARIWLETSQVRDAFRDMPHALSEDELRSLRFGLSQVAVDIEGAEPDGYVVVSLHALEIVEVDYIEWAR